MKFRFVQFILLLGLFAFSKVSATHIVGGEFEMLHKVGYQYQFRQIQYFDVVNGDPRAKDQIINASVFRKRDNVFVRSIVMNYQNESLVPYTNPTCTNNRLVTNRIVYSKTVTLNPDLFDDPEGYYMVWERCCRNNIITNIVAPDKTGQTFYLEFPPIRKDKEPFINSSPQLFPPLSDYACVNRFYYVDFRGTDPDGDSLVYSLATPLNSSAYEPLPTPTPNPHPTVTWVDGVGDTYQIPGNPTLSINTKGFLIVTPSEEGLFVFSVKCEEFRNGEKIGEVLRDFQLFVIDCPDPGTPPEIQVKAPGAEIFTDHLDTILLKVDDERCFDFRIKDRDGGETISLRAVPVNFEENVQSILSTNIGYIDRAEDTLGVQVCLPDCPYVQDGPYIIDIIAQDFTCPLPLMDTLRLAVIVEPPPNKPPKFIKPEQKVINATFVEGSVIEIPIEAEDADQDSLLLSMVTDGFALQDYGIVIDTVLDEKGKLKLNLQWDTDCQVYPFGLKNEFQLKFYVDDDDQCSIDNRDSIIMNIMIELPANNEPVVLVDNDHANKTIDVKVLEDLDFDVLAQDADATDSLSLVAVGLGFNLEDIGLSFIDQNGKSRIRTNLDGQIGCNDVNLTAQQDYSILLIAEDADKCKVPNADTVMLTLHVNPPENHAPIIYVNDEELTDTIFVDAGMMLGLNLSGVDQDNDNLTLRMINAETAGSLGVQFEPQTGVGLVATPFSWPTSCSLLADNFQPASYHFEILLKDDKCMVPMADTLQMMVVVRDKKIDYDFLPPNVFTPNDGDNINATYYVPGMPGDNCERQFKGVAIYNRWGKKVFSSSKQDFHWDGAQQPSGVYYYYISYTDFDVKGTVSLIR